MPKPVFTAFFILMITASCKKEDVENPVIQLYGDPVNVHYRTKPYEDPGAKVFDDKTCMDNSNLTIENNVNVDLYGTYTVKYTAVDDAGNSTSVPRFVDIVLPIEDYYNQEYSAFDTCTSGNYFYAGLIQDCDCGNFSVMVGNISDFGQSATFALPLSGDYNEEIFLDTTKAMVHFFGTGIMNPSADTLFWNYSIQDSISIDVCRSVWIKND